VWGGGPHAFALLAAVATAPSPQVAGAKPVPAEGESVVGASLGRAPRGRVRAAGGRGFPGHEYLDGLFCSPGRLPTLKLH